MTADRNQGREDRTVEVLVLSGSMGSGKTSVLIEASDLLTAAQVPHAAVDFDMLALGYWRDWLLTISRIGICRPSGVITPPRELGD